MTNEQLAAFIQQGGNDELIPILWENVRKLMYSNSRRYFNACKAQCDRSGVELWDVYQACYTAFIEAVKSYKADSGYKFTSYLDYPFKNEVRELFGTRTAKREPLNECTSLDKPVEQSGGDSCTLLEMVTDDTSLAFIEDIEQRCDAEIIRAVVDTLSEPYKCVIRLYFFDSVSLSDIAAKLVVSPERVRQIKNKALRILRKNRQLLLLYDEQRRHDNWIRHSRFRFSPEYCEIINQIDERQLTYGQRQAAIYSARHEWEQECVSKREFSTRNLSNDR